MSINNLNEKVDNQIQNEQNKILQNSDLFKQNFESSEKYEKLKEFDVGWHKISLWELKWSNVIDVYLDCKKCWDISTNYWLDQVINPTLIWGEIYFRNGDSYEMIKNWQIEDLENVSYVYEFDNRPVFIEFDNVSKKSKVKLWDKDLWTYRLIHDVDWNYPWFEMNFNFGDLYIGGTKKFWFIWKINNKEVFVTENWISDAFDEIEVIKGWNYPTIRWKTFTEIQLS